MAAETCKTDSTRYWNSGSLHRRTLSHVVDGRGPEKRKRGQLVVWGEAGRR